MLDGKQDRPAQDEVRQGICLMIINTPQHRMETYKPAVMRVQATSACVGCCSYLCCMVVAVVGTFTDALDGGQAIKLDDVPDIRVVRSWL
jgi:hypothetical protein